MPSATQQQQAWANQLQASQLSDALFSRNSDTANDDAYGDYPQDSSPTATRNPNTQSDIDSNDATVNRTPDTAAAQLENQKMSDWLRNRARRALQNDDPLGGATREGLETAKKEGTRMVRAYLNIASDGAAATLVGVLIMAAVWLLRAGFTRFTFLRESRFGDFLAFQGRGIRDLVQYGEPTPKWGMIGAILILFVAGLLCAFVLLLILLPFISVAMKITALEDIPIIGDMIKLLSP